MNYLFNLGNENWFGHKHIFPYLLQSFKNSPNTHFLEIGSWKGRSAIFMLQNILTHPTSKLTCVDLWDINDWNPKAEETQTLWNNPNRQKELDCANLYDIFLYNIKPYKDKVEVIKDYSTNALRKFIHHKIEFDFIYIDAEHTTEAVKKDFCMATQCIKNNHIIFLDDYSWDSVKFAIEELEKEFNIKFNTKDNGAWVHIYNKTIFKEYIDGMG